MKTTLAWCANPVLIVLLSMLWLMVPSAPVLGQEQKTAFFPKAAIAMIHYFYPDSESVPRWLEKPIEFAART